MDEMPRARYERRSIYPSTTSVCSPTGCSPNLPSRVFTEVPLHRLNHWPLVINSVSFPSLLPGGWGVGLKVPTL